MIRNSTRQTILANKIIQADNPWLRLKGLLGRKEFPLGEALIIKPCQSIHMMFMAFSIDVIFLNAKGEVVGLCPCIPPFAFSPIFWQAKCAIELPQNTIAKSQTSLGDLIQIGNF